MKKTILALTCALASVSVQAINVWTGATSTDFNTAGNWGDNVVPSGSPLNVDVLFDSSSTNQNAVLSADTTWRNTLFNGGNYTLGGANYITLAGGAWVQLGSGTANVTAPVYQTGGNGFFIYGAGTGPMTFGGQEDFSLLNTGNNFVKYNFGDVTFTNTVLTRDGLNLGVRAGRLILSDPGNLNEHTGIIMMGLPGYFNNNFYTDCSGAGILLDDTATAVANRLGAARSIQFGSRALLEFRGNASAPSIQASSGDMDLAVYTTLANSGPGQRIRISNGSGQSAQLIFNNLKLNNGANNQSQNGQPCLMTMLVPSGSTLGAAGTAAGGRLIFTNAPALDNGILRYFFVKDEVSGNVDFGTYNTTIDNGAQLGVQASTTYARTNDIKGAGATENVLQIGSYTTPFTNSPACNALKIVPTNTLGSIELGTNQFWIKNAGGLIFQGGYDYAINGTTNLYFGTGAGASSYAYIATNTLTINTRVVREGEFEKAGDGLLVFAGPTYFMDSDRRIAVDKGAGSGDDLQISSPISGTGRFSKDGAGTLALTGSGDNSGLVGNQFGGAALFAGTLVLAKDTQDLQNKALGTNFISFSTPGAGALAARGFPYSTTNGVSLAYQGSPGACSRFVGDQPLTFAGLTYGVLNSGQTYPVVNDATAAVTFSGILQAFNTNNATAQSGTLEFSGSGNTVVSGVVRNGDPTWANIATMTTAITKSGTGRLTLSGTCTNTALTGFFAGQLRLDSPTALPPNYLNIRQSQMYPDLTNAPILELGTGWSTFTRATGNGLGQIMICNPGAQQMLFAGFASVSGTKTVNLGGASAKMIWASGSGFFNLPNPDSYTGGLVLGSLGTAGTLDFQNPIELNQRSRQLAALDGAADVDGIISGVISSDTNAVAGITKLGTGTLQFTANNTYTGPTLIKAGRLLVSGSLASSDVTVATGGTLGGSGPIAGPVTVQDGGTLSAGASIGTLVINNSLSLSNNSITAVEINASTGARDQVTGLTTVTYGGTLIVTTNYAGTVTNGQTFQIFSVTTPSGNFSSISNQVAGVTSWAFNPASGVLTATVSAVAPTPTNITYTVTGTSPNQQLVLDWPAGQGWQLQAQTNNLATGLTTNWVNVTGATPPFTNPVSPVNGSVFYRLKY